MMSGIIRRKAIVSAVLGGAVVAVGLVLKSLPESGTSAARARQTELRQQEADRLKAQEQFLSWAATAKKSGATYEAVDPYDVARMWGKCFKIGGSAADYAAILATGERSVDGDTVRYEWAFWLPYDPHTPDASQLYMEVLVKGNPPLIIHFSTSKSMD
jgi:hypothetical protein